MYSVSADRGYADQFMALFTPELYRERMKQDSKLGKRGHSGRTARLVNPSVSAAGQVALSRYEMYPRIEENLSWSDLRHFAA